MSETKIGLIVFFIVTSVIGFLIGTCQSVAKGQCTHDSLLSYYPSYFIGCELGKKRF